MGYNTSILLLNDAKDLFQDNPEKFTQNVLKMMDITGEVEPGKSLPLGHYCNPMSLITRSHADTSHLVLIGQNSSESLLQTQVWHGEDQKNLDILKKAALKFGCRLVKDYRLIPE